MDASLQALVAQIQALSLKKHLGIDVSGEVRRVVRMCRNDQELDAVVALCNALGLPYE